MLTPGEKRSVLREYIVGQGFWANDGVKYGVDFLVYTDDPSRVHSKYGVVVGSRLSYQQLIAQQRVCSSNNKILLVAFVDGPGAVRLVQCERLLLRPKEEECGMAE